MKRIRIAFPVLAVVLVACAGVGRRDRLPGGLLEGVVLFGSSSSVTALDAGSGSVLFAKTGVPALGDWSTLFTTTTDDGSTSLETYDAPTGDLVSSVEVPDGFGLRVAATDGSQVAMVRGAPAPDDWTPYPRSKTEILVVDPSGEARPLRFVLDGNFDPEAFSLGGRRLMLLQYVPATAPEAYRVTSLDLQRGTVSPVPLTHAKAVAETMSGTRLEQLAAPDGRRLFTLYSSQPPAYSSDGSSLTDPVAFVHVLDLRYSGSAHCIALPEDLWGGDPRVEAMALAPSGDFLYVVDAERGIVTEIDAERGRVVRTGHVDFGASIGETHAVMTDASTLVVGTGSSLVTIDTRTLREVASRDVGGEVGGLGGAGDRLLVATAERVEVIEPSTGEEVERLPSPAIDDLDYIGSLEL